MCIDTHKHAPCFDPSGTSTYASQRFLNNKRWRVCLANNPGQKGGRVAKPSMSW